MSCSPEKYKSWMFRPKQMHSCARNRALETREDGGTLEKFKLGQTNYW
jgi:hypothetical protein